MANNRHTRGKKDQKAEEEARKAKEDARKEFNGTKFKSEWITTGADAYLPEYAEKMGKFMANNGLTNSKIRNVFGEIRRIQMGGFENEKASFYLLRPKMAYALGRDRNIAGLHLFKMILDESAKYVENQKAFDNFCDLMEAILAYHKATPIENDQES